MLQRSADTVVVLDFETTGLSPDQGDRAIEIGAVLIEQGVITASFQRLMNPGQRISPFIESYTGISNQMLQQAPVCEQVMAEFAGFIDGHNLVAHNASFDRRFLAAELQRIGQPCIGPFVCSMLLARRIYPAAPNHTLGGLVSYTQIPNDGVFHRALADAEMTGRLWLRMLTDLQQCHGVATPTFAQLQQLSKTPKAAVARYLSRL